MSDSPVAVVTGASRGLGRAVAAGLAADGWRVIADARDAAVLRGAVGRLPGAVPVPGDVTDPAHRADLAHAVASLGRLDLLVNNAGILGPSPQPPLAAYPVEALREVYEVNVVAPLALTALLLPAMRGAGTIVNVTSDAAVEAYPGWGGYGSAKAAVDQLTAVLAAEHPELAVYAFDPGDMNTRMHQDAFPGEDIGDRPAPERVVPALLALIRGGRPSGRYRAADLSPVAA